MQDMETSTIKGRKIISQKKRLKSLSMIFYPFMPECVQCVSLINVVNSSEV
ncbi:hypothetical protein ESA_01777 [Cronobacter sakazakii ATCC BAA-894]|uniref:Uncharacterized protein n=1 Tax=Cronobacter sakazakii (strain ATCC BAA-894) TaxID=290339 RepID=A7MLA6_CROS8|nr:hypothetical protein ESA_01777 [Cronobacter sakazakii ATCC BAA-894]